MSGEHLGFLGGGKKMYARDHFYVKVIGLKLYEERHCSGDFGREIHVKVGDSVNKTIVDEVVALAVAQQTYALSRLFI